MLLPCGAERLPEGEGGRREGGVVVSSVVVWVYCAAHVRSMRDILYLHWGVLVILHAIW